VRGQAPNKLMMVGGGLQSVTTYSAETCSRHTLDYRVGTIFYPYIHPDTLPLYLVPVHTERKFFFKNKDPFIECIYIHTLHNTNASALYEHWQYLISS